MILERVQFETNIQTIFVESICTDKGVLKANMQMKQKSPDYINMTAEEAERDFERRLQNYEQVYKEIAEVRTQSFVICCFLIFFFSGFSTCICESNKCRKARDRK